ncbi:hypothetical protein V6N12_010405 [Hibiscus sabdariffa]|uniref:Uncharacterized protein n=1 Tax=Hibiscus sabdariffa TaxID=183260 RepID=A0ABR2ENS1_9ROSI
MGGVFKDDLIINEEVAADVAEKEKRQTEKLIDNTSERNVLVGQVVGLVENSGLVVKLVGGSETKKLKLAEKDVREFWGDDDFGFCYSEAAGKSSGLLVVWDNKSLQEEVYVVWLEG